MLKDRKKILKAERKVKVKMDVGKEPKVRLNVNFRNINAQSESKIVQVLEMKTRIVN